MKILVISAHHPPFHMGGYGLRIKDIMDGLANRGHHILVLTTHKRIKLSQGNERSNYDIKRKLFNRNHARFFPKELLFDLLDTKTIEREIKRFEPDLIYLGHTYPLTKQLLPYLANQGRPLFYDEGGNGLKGAWTEHGRWFRFCGEWQSNLQLVNKLKPFVIKAVKALSWGRIIENWHWPKDMQIMFNSALNLENARSFGLPVDNARVIHSGVDTEKFSFKARDGLSSPLRIIIPGRIEEKKGQLDGVRLVHALRAHGVDVVLTLVGSIAQEAYFERIKAEIAQYGLLGRVIIHPFADQQELVSLYHQSDICFFPSYHRSGFSRVPLEAMACGCIIISYGNEGSDEIIRNGKNGFLVNAGEISKIREIILSLIDLKENYLSITNFANQLIKSENSMNLYIQNINELSLLLKK